MKKFSFLLIVTLASLFIYNNVVAQVTVIRTISNASIGGVEIFLGAANMDNDPQQEIIYGDPSDYTDCKLVIVDGSTGDIEWESPSTLTNIHIAGYSRSEGDNNGFSPFCDINTDGKMEITFLGREGGTDNIYIVGLQGTTNIILNNNSIPNEISLMQNYPNPFNPTTTIEYQIQKDNFVTIRVYNSVGQLVRALVNESKQSGEYSIVFDGKNEKGQTVSSGAYYYQLQVGDFISNKKMLLIK